MLRLACRRLSVNFSLRALTDRLDSFEKEVIRLKAFRQAVEQTSPEVAKAVERLLNADSSSVMARKENLDLPLTAEEFEEMSQFYALQKANDIKMENLRFIKTKNDLLSHSSAFHREALVRIALIAKMLNLAPYGLSQMPAIQELTRWYQWSFHEFIAHPGPKTLEDLQYFDELSRSVFLRHYNVSRLLSEGLISLAEREGWNMSDVSLQDSFPDLQTFFESFYSSRVKLRFLCGNYLHLSSQTLQLPRSRHEEIDKDGLTEPNFFGLNPATFVGQICEETSLYVLVKGCVADAQKRFPDAKIHLKFVGDDTLTFPGIPYITHDIVMALLSDAVEENYHRQEVSGKHPTDIEVALVQRRGGGSFVLRVSDTAGGMKLNDARMALTCWATFRNFYHHASPLATGDTWIHSPIRLSYANCAAKCIGGNVTVASIQGYGTDRQLYMPAAGISRITI